VGDTLAQGNVPARVLGGIADDDKGAELLRGQWGGKLDKTMLIRTAREIAQQLTASLPGALDDTGPQSAPAQPQQAQPQYPPGQQQAQQQAYPPTAQPQYPAASQYPPQRRQPPAAQQYPAGQQQGQQPRGVVGRHSSAQHSASAQHAAAGQEAGDDRWTTA
jgi:pyruvate/2-oxoglutarate dehydrogenase complex dihydrolipoamide acyltransferase (E2) component